MERSKVIFLFREMEKIDTGDHFTKDTGIQKNGNMENRSFKHWLVVAMMCCLAAGAIGIAYKCDRCILHTCQWKSWCITRKFCDARYIAVTCDGSCNTYLPKIMDRLNYRRVLLAGVIQSIVTTALMGISSSLWMFYLLGILRGIGLSAASI